MSTVRYFDDIPHIGRFGMRDDDKGTSWTFFYRNGIRFTIHVDEKDVSGTTFHSLWRPLLGEDLGMGKSILHNYNKFFELIVSHSMSTLQEISPVKPHWITLRDYLHTPAYHLKLVADEKGTDGVRAVVIEGPEVVAAYELQPAATFKNMPQTIPEYPSSDLTVLDKEADWRRPPHKLRTTDGLICYFKGREQSSTNFETGEINNSSLDSIEAHLRLFKYGQEKGDSYATRRSKVLGIVTDVASASENSDPADEQHNAETNQALVAGILLSSPTISSHTQSLADVVAQSETTTADFTEKTQRWRTQIEDEASRLHDLKLYWGGREDWFYINQYTVLIDAESGNAYLSLDTATFLDDDDATSQDKRTKLARMDNSAIENLFEKWLPGELSGKRSEVS
ncbi:uncharacterized protein BHQ10_001005 [Talaromyces amestolkiae]|uniref:Uncharacterized protein n=1 Tax=Talaromyces amestolkiae TaxID=1196081 RepID=A0A364KN64_TALAM|nr:uncharacterized protein BHQ10_001005 [Talaromyces amestolkiae]RAO64993.1 hypothetical protein BHQ10_001005 [Talaromyces amestolkiae]